MTVAADLTLVTGTLPERKAMLTELLESVEAQTVQPAAHLIVRDDGRGRVATANRAVGMVDTGWLCIVDDDDLLLPNHVETLAANLTADVVWTWVDVRGHRDDWTPNAPYEPGRLERGNYIPVTCAISAELWREQGGWRDVKLHDWDLLRRCERAGAMFLNVPVVTWVFRLHDGNRFSVG